ncbi:nitrite reductase [Caldibacillus sp. 210928-DFI.2.22]|uniref:nitrite reductase n=1 Tax=unclassified Caldibacillus TaxID=2641266 RepID=UPI001D075578|nr:MULTISPECIES: nitrite reductase [unclassified Caldibacillus]MCB7071040.1 nitrite reductase [Caldibacillus sp. 210928-DFI.2.22]MCB7074523.1 nitrite reductase [Caldibacillus sp. 210928-DFI.2.18]
MENKVKLAVNGGIGFGAKLNLKQLMTISKHIDMEGEIELTTFQQLYIEIQEDKKDEVIKEFESVGLKCYPVEDYVKSLRTCNFCKGEEREGMPVAKELNRRIAGKPVPFTLKVAYTGCPIGCGEPMLSDIGVMKYKDHYNLYVGGKAKGRDAEVGTLLRENLTPEELYDTVEKVIATYTENGKKREPFYKFLKRLGKEHLLS